MRLHASCSKSLRLGCSHRTVHAPRLAALAVLTAEQLAYVRSCGLVQLLELAMPGERLLQTFG
jgi:hypothetical protein